MLFKFKSNFKVFLVFLSLAILFYIYVIFDGFQIFKSLIHFAVEPGDRSYLSNVYHAFKDRGIHRYVGSGDAMSQYVHFAEYFRTLFYDTWQLLPQFAPHLSGGQNIFNFSYYGLYNPIYMLSFLVPSLSMITYIEITSVLALAISGYLSYKILEKHGYQRPVCYIVGIVFMSTASITSQSYTNFMFVNYIPFLLLAMIGTKQHIEENKSILLIFSVTTIILMSYYFALPSLITLSMYALYCYFNWHKEIKVKVIVKDGLLYILMLAISISMSAILLLPTIHQILASRVESVTAMDIKTLLSLKIDFALVMYSPYAMGFGILAGIAMVYNLFFKKEIGGKIISVGILLFISFPIFSYFMNGGTSLHSKVFIPFSVLIMLLIASLIRDVIDNAALKGKTSRGLIHAIVLFSVVMKFLDVNLVLNSIKIVDLCITSLLLLCILWIADKKWATYMAYGLVIVALANGLLAQNSFSTYSGVLYDYYFGETIISEVEAALDDEDDLYRFTYLLGSKYHSCNKIFTDRFYRTSLHSSLYNKEFLEFRNHTLDVEQSSGGHSNDYDTEDIMYNMYMGNKYMINDIDKSLGYEQFSQYVYINNDVYPLGFVKDSTLAIEEFNNLSSFEKKEAILKHAVVEKGSKGKMTSSLSPLKLSEFSLQSMDDTLDVEKVDDGYNLNSKGDTQIVFVPNKDMTGQVLLVSFDMVNDTHARIGINGIYNRLMPQSYIYYIENTSFSYVIAREALDEINIHLSEGYFQLRNIKISVIPYEQLKKYVHDMDPLDIALNKTKGNVIQGSIETSGGYFILNMPYDKGFYIEVDGKPTPYERVNGAFIGFPIDEGNHDIRVVYRAPWSKLGALISSLTLLLVLVVYCYRHWTQLSKIPNEARRFCKRNKKYISYLVVGVSTTFISITTYYVMIFLKIDYKVATVLSWLVTVLYAYFMNKRYVFEYEHLNVKNLLKNIFMFYSGRLITLLLDIVLMMVLVEIFTAGQYISKIYVNVLILVINYFISEYIIFRRELSHDEKNPNSACADL